jgi:hypothetical protein
VCVITQNWHDITKKIAEQENRLPVFRYARTITYNVLEWSSALDTSVIDHWKINNPTFDPIRNKSGQWWPCLLTDRDEMSILHRGPSIDASYQVSVHLAEGFQRHISVNLYRDNCILNTDISPLKPLGQMNRNLVGSIYVWSSINTVEFVYNEQAYSEVKINPRSHRYLNNVFLKAYYKFFITKSGLEHSSQRTFHRCFLPSFSSLGWGVSEAYICKSV